MSYSDFLTLIDSNCRILPSDFHQAIKNRWGNLETTEAPGGIRFYFRIGGDDWVSGLLMRDHQAVSFDTHTDEITIEFILWFRGFISPECRLMYFFEPNPENMVEIDLTLTAQEIRERLTSWRS